MTRKAWLGIDIAKQKLDVTVAWTDRKRAKMFSNDQAGGRDLKAWLKALKIDQVHACLEATGRYGEGVALALHQAGHRVSLVNPAQIKHFARTKLGRNKTDKSDAVLICEYGRLFEPAPWTPPSPALRQLRDLVRTREALAASRVDGTNRRGSGHFAPAADAAMAAVIAQLDARWEQVAAVERAIGGGGAGD